MTFFYFLLLYRENSQSGIETKQIHTLLPFPFYFPLNSSIWNWVPKAHKSFDFILNNNLTIAIQPLGNSLTLIRQKP